MTGFLFCEDFAMPRLVPNFTNRNMCSEGAKNRCIFASSRSFNLTQRYQRACSFRRNYGGNFFLHKMSLKARITVSSIMVFRVFSEIGSFFGFVLQWTKMREVLQIFSIVNLISFVHL